MEGIFSGKIFVAGSAEPKQIQPGPLPMPKWEDPVTQAMGKMEASFQYEPNGAVECRPDRIEFLGS